MIILDDPTETAKNAVVVRSPDPLPPPPPPYSPPYRETDPLLGYGIPSNTNSERDGPTWLVLWLACATCLLGGFILSIQLGSHPSHTNPPSRNAPPRYPAPGTELCFPYKDWSDPSSGSLGKHVTLQIPNSARRIMLLSRGNLAAGSLAMSADPDIGASEISVKVVTIGSTDNLGALAYATLCYSVNWDGQYNVTIAASSPPALREHLNPLNLSVLINLPHNEAASVGYRRYPDIYTNMPYFAHTVRSIEGGARLGQISFITADRRVKVDKLIAQQVNIRTTNASIHGAFDVNRQLSLFSDSGHIDVTADITSSNTITAWSNTTLAVSNGSVNARLRLHTSSWHGLGGSFNISASGTNSSIDLDIDAAPISSRIALNAANEGAPVVVTLPTTFEGAFIVETTQPNRATLNLRENVEDPTGEGRKRDTAVMNIRDQHFAGFVRWTSMKRGGVHVQSDNQATLTV